MIPGLDQQALNTICTILAQFPKVEHATLFGSRAKGTHNQRSDIDLALFGINLDRHDINRIHLELEDSDLPTSVDLLDYNRINNPRLKDHIDRMGETIFRRSG
ncbi:MAG: nucleotidyltransferase domain-containing protein [Saccharospirillum sp.]